jgi:deoxyribose-phosphate aldolase
VDPAQRRELTVPELAAMVEHRLHRGDLTAGEFTKECSYAATAGLATVLCRPEQVALAARALAGTQVRVVTALGYHDPSAPTLSVAALTAQAGELIDQGVHEVTLLAAPGVMPHASPGLLLDQAAAVLQCARPQDVSVRVAINCDDMTDAHITDTCQQLARAGVHLVQGGSISGGRASLARVQTMRAALPHPILLKWTHPVRGLDTLLVCIALRIDRFNGKPRALLADAERAAQIGPLTVPALGIDL